MTTVLAEGERIDHPEVHAEVDRILAELLARATQLTDAVLLRMHEEIATYADPVPELKSDVHDHVIAHVRSFIACAREHRAPTEEEVVQLRGVVVRRTRQGIPLEAILHAFRIGHRIIWQAILTEAKGSEVGGQAGLLLAAPSMDYIDAVSTAVTETYVTERQRQAAEEDRAQRDLVEDLLAGRLPLSDALAQLAGSLQLEPSGQYVVAALAPPFDKQLDRDISNRAGEALRKRFEATRERALVIARREDVVCIVAVADGNSSSAHAAIRDTMELLHNEDDVSLAAGISVICEGWPEIPRGYDKAHLALGRAPVGQVLALSELGLLDYLVASADPLALRVVPELTRRILSHDRARGADSRKTLKAFVECDLNVRKAAEALHVHPNTLHYRLNRLSEALELDLRHLPHLVDVYAAVKVIASDAN